MKTAAEILKAKKCGDLFEKDLASVKAEYRSLAKIYHPDVYKEPDADAVFANLSLLYDTAMNVLEHGKGVWEVSNALVLTTKLGKVLTVQYLSEKIFELGKFYICRDKIVYILDHKKYYDNAIRQIKNLGYANDKMRQEFERYMPRLVDTFETIDSKWCLIISKTEDVFLLEDLLVQQGGKLPERHVAWIMSRLTSIGCYLYSRGIVHNGISLNNCFVSPQYHTILLLGGWWYAVPQGEKMLGTQKAIFDIMPLKDKTEKIANFRTDIESTKLIGKQLLADMSLITKKGAVDTIPAAFKEWLNKGTSDNPIDEFNAWDKALTASWGKREFIVLDVKEKDIYNL